MTRRKRTWWDCPNAWDHTVTPDGYVARAEWFQLMARTHSQQQCRSCDRWTIWSADAVMSERQHRDAAERTAQRNTR
jgi:hypothetical protein